MEFIDPIDVAAERTLILSELSVLLEFLDVLWKASTLPEGADERFVIDIDLVGGVPTIEEPAAEGSPCA